jgi:hypothetical protein
MCRLCVSNYIAWVHNVFFAGFKADLVDLAFADKSEETTAGGVGVSPMR